MKFRLGINNAFKRELFNDIVFANKTGLTYQTKNNRCYLTESGLFNLKGYFFFQGELLVIKELIGNEEIEDTAIDIGNIWIEKANGEKHKLAKSIVRGIVHTSESSSRCETDIFFYKSKDNIGNEVIHSVNVENRLKASISLNEILLYQTASSCYTNNFIRKEVSLSKYSHDLEFLWQQKGYGRFPVTKSSILPLFCNDILIFNFLAQRSPTGRVDGEIYALDDDSGDVIWTKKFPRQVDDVIKLNDDIVLAYSGSDLCKLNVSNGEITEQVPTSFGEKSIVQMALCGDYVFLFNDKEEAVHIYHKESFTCEREISFTGQTIFNKPVVFDNTLYVGAYNAELGRGLFAFDTTDIHAELDIEQQLNFKVIDPPEPNSPLVIEIHNQTFDDIARLGEQFIIKELWEHGKNSSYDGRYRTKGYFNGQLILKCYDIPNKPDALTQYVADMEERITLVARHENYGMGLRSSDGENYSTLTIELIDTQ